LQAYPVALKPLVDQARLELLGAAEIAASRPRGRNDELEVVEAIVSADSPLIDQTLEGLRLRQRYEVNVLALSRGGRQVIGRLRSNRFRLGDVIVLQGRSQQLAEALSQLGCLPLAERNLAIGRPRFRLLPLVILAGAMALTVAGVLPVEAAFFIAAVATVLSGQITPREAYAAIEWPILVMLGCLIPVGESLRSTGAAAVLAHWLGLAASGLPGVLPIGLVLIVSMLVTPFLHHVAAVLVLGPVAAAVAKSLGYAPDPFLMAVALGASCDFLTPVGHQNNMLVMGPGGYRFGDFWRLGLPLTTLVAVGGTWLIVRAWPMH
jgi:di/tricarboxylate transporter